MRGTITRALKGALWATGHYRRALATRRFPGVAVLCYHGVLAPGTRRDVLPFGPLHVDADELDAHCALIAAQCQPLSLGAAEAVWSGSEASAPRPVLVTFDDGHRTLLEVALPILRRHGVPALVFACTGAIEQQRSFWFDAVARARGEGAVEAAKSLPFTEWQALAAAHDVAATPGDPLAPLSVGEVAALAADPLITIGAHTISHPILARAPRAEQRDEIVRSVDTIARWTGRRPTSFAFPNGRPGLDYDDTTVALLGEAGITSAFTTVAGFAPAGGTPLERQRFLMLHGVNAAELAHRLAHSWT